MILPGYLKTRALAARGCALLRRMSREKRTEKALRSAFYIGLWSRAAEEIGATVVDAHGDLLTIERAGAIARVFRNYTDLDGPVTLRAAGSKSLSNAILRAHRIPAPNHETFTLHRLATACEFLRSHAPCVVKPAAGTGAGAGVTTGIVTRKQLVEASIAAAAYGDGLLIEQQVAGRNLRLLYLDGELLDAVERRPPTVVGDGQATVARLVENANKERRRAGTRAAQVLLRRDLELERTLAQQGLCWRSVPAPGELVQVKTVINDNRAADNVSVIDAVSDEIVDTGRLAARACDVRLAGVDVVTPDYTADLASAGGVVLEINTTPGLYVHQSRGAVRVAAPILEACLRSSRRRPRVGPALPRLSAEASLAAEPGGA